MGGAASGVTEVGPTNPYSYPSYSTDLHERSGHPLGGSLRRLSRPLMSPWRTRALCEPGLAGSRTLTMGAARDLTSSNWTARC